MASTRDKVETKAGPRNDAYTGFLAISFLAMVGATVLLYLEYQSYENKTPPKAPALEVPGVQLKSVPNSGNAPVKVEPKAPTDDAMPKEKEKEMMRLPNGEDKFVPRRLGDQTTQVSLPIDKLR